MINNFHRGVTVLELLIVVGVLGIIFSIVLPSFQTIKNNSIIQTVASDMFSALDKARSQTLSSVDSSEYGVHFQSDKIVIFKGQTYSSSDPGNEEIIISAPVTISSINLTGGATDLYFDKLSGAPSKIGTITVSTSSLLKTITISATGAASMN